jgi:predicted kinase
MTRLSFDQEARSRGITTMPLPEDVHRDIEHVLRARLANLVRAGSDVVLDFSFWSRHMRDEYRQFLRPFGVIPETVYLDRSRHGAPAHRCPGGRGWRRLQDQH